MWLVFIGPPGAGKGTQAEWLVQHLSIAHLSTGDILRRVIGEGTEIGQSAKTYIDAGKLVPDEIVVELVRQRIAADDCRRGALFDGFPRTLAQAESLDQLLSSRGTPLDAVLQLEVPDDELVDRLVGRGRSDDRPDVIRRRLEVFHNQSEPVSEYYQRKGILRTINGTGTVAEVMERIQAVVG